MNYFCFLIFFAFNTWKYIFRMLKLKWFVRERSVEKIDILWDGGIVVIKPNSGKDLSKIERIYEKYKNLMYKESYGILHDPHDTEDAIQQAFLRLIRVVDRIKDDDHAMLCNFLKIVVRNVSKDLYNKRIYLNNTEDTIDVLEDSALNVNVEVTDIVISRESVARIAREIENLPDKYREVLLLEKVFGYSREETMVLLNQNYETLKKRMTRGKKKLLEALRKEELDDGRQTIGKNAK